MPEPFVVRLDVRNRGALLSAICADVPGLHVYGMTLEAVRQSAIKAIPTLMKANRQMTVAAYPTDELSEIRIKPI